MELESKIKQVLLMELLEGNEGRVSIELLMEQLLSFQRDQKGA